MKKKYDVFISYKRTINGILTEDAVMAKELYETLLEHGIRAFFSEESLAVLGADRYKEKIDEVLDQCSVLVVVGTSVANLTSSWVKYEWDSFYTDILSERKQAKMFSYVDGISPHKLPRTLRTLQSFEKDQYDLETIAGHIKNALDSIGQIEERPEQFTNISNNEQKLSPQSQLLKFANLISCGDVDGHYVNPYISDEMADIVANHVGNISAYNAERCLEEDLNPVLFEVFLAQKIARINKPDNCIKSFNILHQIINSWTVFLNEDKKVVSYWIFISLKEDSYSRISKGQTEECDIDINDTRFIDMPGHYKGYLLLSGTIKECRTPKVNNPAKIALSFQSLGTAVPENWYRDS